MNLVVALLCTCHYSANFVARDLHTHTHTVSIYSPAGRGDVARMKVEWLRDCAGALPHWATAVQKVLLVGLPSAAAESIFPSRILHLVTSKCQPALIIWNAHWCCDNFNGCWSWIWSFLKFCFDLFLVSSPSWCMALLWPSGVHVAQPAINCRSWKIWMCTESPTSSFYKVSNQ